MVDTAGLGSFAGVFGVVVAGAGVVVSGLALLVGSWGFAEEEVSGAAVSDFDGCEVFSFLVLEGSRPAWVRASFCAALAVSEFRPGCPPGAAETMPAVATVVASTPMDAAAIRAEMAVMRMVDVANGLVETCLAALLSWIHDVGCPSEEVACEQRKRRPLSRHEASPTRNVFSQVKGRKTGVV